MIADDPPTIMPYNTRRKSLSLEALGIHLPVTHASRAAARLSPPSATQPSDQQQQPAKKVKRSHEESPSMSPPPKRDPVKYEDTPPPSPAAEGDSDEEVKPREISLEGINDEIVEGVIVQLQKTGNRPHLVKELAAILSENVKIVETSANPSAIISSRLSSYLKRSWSALAPCPIAKELETVHPRRTYFYLTTYPHQPIPDPAIHAPQRTIISPSLSSAASRSDDADGDRRRMLSPSPEIDLSSPEYEDENLATPPTPTGSFSGRAERPIRNNRSSSPPLEKDEKEFTQTARGMQKRKLSEDIPMSGVPSEVGGTTRTSDADVLFYGEGRGLNVVHTSVFSSPAMKPSLALNTLKKPFEESVDIWGRVESTMDWDMRSPENVELSELDGMLDDF
ncbi:hypothetical protein B7494_g1384 [Chlorociboria aeruginascens]|nr:hypothetical protein B7494_g1384 [Chlorociboria aeruginascens]